MSSQDRAGVALMPLVYVSDIDRAVAFYAAFGMEPVAKSRRDHWAELRLGDATHALHAADPLPPPTDRVVLCLEAREPLEALVERLADAGVAPSRPTTDEAFGRSLEVTDPDGLVVQVNEHDPELYT
jgi:catechol 2,3-dioxygenase-like lactoylglutathione lyase family enzyme